MHCIVDIIPSGHDLFISEEWLSFYLSVLYLSAVFCSSIVYLLANIFVLNSKRVSGFDQAPPQQALPIVATGAIPGMNLLLSYYAYKLIKNDIYIVL